MDESYTTQNKHTIEAENEDEARIKIENYYKDISSDYYENFSVNGIDFFKHIN